MPRAIVGHVVAEVRNFAFVLVSAFIVIFGSERTFWYWSPGIGEQLGVALFYMVPVGGVLWAISRYRIGQLWTLLLAVPLLGYVVEGVITPVLYSGGPFVPFFPIWFTAWHGLLSFVVLWYLVHTWLVANRSRALLLVSIAYGVFWGAWSITLTLPESVNDPEVVADQGGPLEVLGPLSFTGYALTFTAMLAASHYLLGRLWLTTYEPSRWLRWLWVAVVGAIVVGWTVVIWWAAPMFVGYVWLQLWALRRTAAVATGPTILEQLSGPVTLRSLAPLALIPVVAAATYTLAWEADLSDLAKQVILYGTITVQTLIAAALMSLSLWRAARLGSRRGPNSVELATPVAQPIAPPQRPQRW